MLFLLIVKEIKALFGESANHAAMTMSHQRITIIPPCNLLNYPVLGKSEQKHSQDYRIQHGLRIAYTTVNPLKQ
jgi:hypothetical protein